MIEQLRKLMGLATNNHQAAKIKCKGLEACENIHAAAVEQTTLAHAKARMLSSKLSRLNERMH